MAAFIGPLIGLATGALGLGGQMSGSKQQKKLLNQQSAEQQQAFQNLQTLFQKWNQMTPAQMSQQLSQLTNPITANQATAVNNAVSPMMANMGLAGSAGQLQANMAPILAQFQGQNQGLAAQLMQQMNQMPAAIAGAEAGSPQSMGQFLQQPGQGGAGSMFGQSLTDLLAKLKGGGGGGLPTYPTAANINSGAWIPPDLSSIGTPGGTIGGGTTGFPIDASVE